MTTEALPVGLTPMLASPGPLPDGDVWAYETKWDGVRAVVTVGAGASVNAGAGDDRTFRIESRRGLDQTGSFPELTALLEVLDGHDVVLDGEIVAFDEGGRPSFHRIQHRLGVTGMGAVSRTQSVPIVYAVFDLLHLDGQSTRALPWTARRKLLELLIDEPGPFWRLSAVYDDGAMLWAATREAGLEGVVAKRRDAPYAPGRRSASWVKVKHVTRDRFLIAGWCPGEGRRSGGLGALILALPETDAPVSGPVGAPPLRYVGKVGTGFNDAELTRLGALLAERALADTTSTVTPDPREPGQRFIGSELWCEVEYLEWSPEGLLRFPSYKGLVSGPDPSPDE